LADLRVLTVRPQEFTMPAQPVIGIDVAKRQSQACLLGPDGNERVKELIFVHTLAGLRKLLALCWWAAKKFCHLPVVILEATGHYSRLISDFLRWHGFETYVVNPIQTKSFANVMLRKVKNDRIDAFKIATFYRLGLVRPAREFPAASLALRELCRHYLSLQRLLTNTKLKRQSLLDQIFWRFDEVFSESASRTASEVLKRFLTPERLAAQSVDDIATLIRQHSRCTMSVAWERAEKLILLAQEAQLLCTASAVKEFRLQSLLNLQDTLSREVQALHKRIEQEAEEHPEVCRVMTVPGFGPITAATFIGEIGSYKLYRSAAQIIAAAGVDPTVYQSGAYQGGHSRMSKRGSTWLRLVLYQAAAVAVWAPIKHQTARYAAIRAFYQKKIEAGKRPKVALGAVMRKLCVYAYAVLSKNKDFENLTVSKTSDLAALPKTN
jgi:transposase